MKKKLDHRLPVMLIYIKCSEDYFDIWQAIRVHYLILMMKNKYTIWKIFC